MRVCETDKIAITVLDGGESDDVHREVLAHAKAQCFTFDTLNRRLAECRRPAVARPQEQEGQHG
jgi:hypothetical protein